MAEALRCYLSVQEGLPLVEERIGTRRATLRGATRQPLRPLRPMLLLSLLLLAAVLLVLAATAARDLSRLPEILRVVGPGEQDRVRPTGAARQPGR
jgi:hypothetical protein